MRLKLHDYQVIVDQGTAMLDSDVGILNLKSFRVGYIYRASLGMGDGHSAKAEGADAVETEMIFTRPLILIRLAQFLQKIQVECHTTSLMNITDTEKYNIFPPSLCRQRMENGQERNRSRFFLLLRKALLNPL